MVINGLVVAGTDPGRHWPPPLRSMVRQPPAWIRGGGHRNDDGRKWPGSARNRSRGAVATAAAIYGPPAPGIDPFAPAEKRRPARRWRWADQHHRWQRPRRCSRWASAAATPFTTQPPHPSNEALGLFSHILESAGATLALIWFLVGSLIFFITAGILAGLSFRRATRALFVVDSGEPAAYELSDAPLQPAGDDLWPSSLP